MHVTLVHIKIKPEARRAFLEATRHNHEQSVLEPGNRRFDVLEDPGDATHFLLYEAYESATDAAQHKETPHYALWRETVEPMMAEPRQGVLLRGLWP